LVSPGFAGAVLAGLAVVVACSPTLGCPVVGSVVWGMGLVVAGCEVPSFVLFGVNPLGPVVPGTPPLLASLPLPAWAGSAVPLGLPGRALPGFRFAVPCWVRVPDEVPDPCWVPGFVTMVCGGSVVVAEVDVAFVGKTGLVEVFAFVSMSACCGTGVWPELIAAAFICSDFDIGGATPV